MEDPMLVFYTGPTDSKCPTVSGCKVANDKRGNSESVWPKWTKK